MKAGKATIHDISKALGIDSSTVSRALNGSPRVSKKTKDKIFEKARELGYQRNNLASNLRTQKTFTIAVVLPRISRYFFATVISGIEEKAYQAGYNVIICQSLDSLKREKKIISSLISNRVDGILMSISMQTASFEHLEAYMNLGKPIVFFDRPCNLKGSININIDNYKASFEATEHLIQQGCKHIVHFSGAQNIELYRQRKAGYIEALKKHGLTVNGDYIFESNLSESDGIWAAKRILELKNVDGIYSSNDTAAIAAMQYLKSKGVTIPKDIAVVGFNNDPISAVIEPPLTTINQPAFRIGKIASELLLKKIQNKDTENDSIFNVLNSELIVRASSEK
ncbi:LacI family DNA-binding transcriptional regulator [Tamlana fucoidanivorans]|uniref:LacI family transcriptional regulator n=1 Tax=Allotamlana fucoidanivorans TaxID=2583814 RepID=A0A5C4SFX7_9FLAO|nr:LacI family DNA-binding transcriptional regulator [Tamlana fucoidanivorans]TNJ42522.1 LacI family transcriptional regulator [Tamlana fucoidanivorans]